MKVYITNDSRIGRQPLKMMKALDSNGNNFCKQVIFLFIILFNCGSFSMAQRSIDGYHQSIKQFVRQYAPELEPLLRLKDSDSSMFLTDKRNYHDVFPTNFHECLHQHCNSLNRKLGTSRTYFFNGKEVKVPLTKGYKTIRINEIVSRKVKDSVPRYALYVLGTSLGENVNPDTRENGVFGLLEEFIAYYYGCHVYDKMYTFLKDKYPVDSLDIWYNYLGEYSNMINSYYEFRLFIGYYLLYAKSKLPELYQSYTQNKELNDLISRVDSAFKLLIDHYQAIREEILKRSGSRIFVLGGYLVSRNDSERFLLPDKEIALLKTEYAEKIEPQITFR